QVAQRLLKRVPRCFGQPRKVLLGLSQLPRLLRVTDERAAAAVFAPLLQADVPHKPAGIADILSELPLLGGGCERVSTYGQHLTALLLLDGNSSRSTRDARPLMAFTNRRMPYCGSSSTSSWAWSGITSISTSHAPFSFTTS